ncbi:MAG: calcium-binding protein [Arenibacterium sp.]
MIPSFTDLSSLDAWTQYAQSIISFSGSPDLIDSFDWSKINQLTVEDYLELLDDAEALLENFDWSFLSAQIPLITSLLQQQGVPQAQIDQSIGFLTDFVNGDISYLTDAFDMARAFLVGYAPSAVLFDAVSGAVGPISTTPTPGDDVLTGNRNDNVIKALAGDDVIDGKAGDDILIGDAGNDEIIGGSGKDRLIGRGGSDDLKGGSGKDKLSGGKRGDDLVGGRVHDILFGGKGLG